MHITINYPATIKGTEKNVVLRLSFKNQEQASFFLNREELWELHSSVQDFLTSLTLSGEFPPAEERPQLKEPKDLKGSYIQFLSSRTKLDKKEFDQLIDDLVSCDKKLDEIKKDDIGVSFLINEENNTFEVLDLRSSRSLEDVYIDMKKIILTKILKQ